MASHHHLKAADQFDPHEFLASDEEHGGGHEHHVHVTPFWTMFWVFIILLALTGLTVWSSNLHGFWFGNTHIVFGPTAHILIAMTIATVKMLLVGGFFMHLIYDKKINTIVMVSTFFALALFIGLVLMDFDTRYLGNRLEVGETVSGGDISKYKGDLRGSAQGFQGSIVQSAQAEAAAAHGNEQNPAGADHAPETTPPADPAHPAPATETPPPTAPH